MDLLPDGVLADILRRLGPCSLAASRCVRKSWCTIIDSMRLLRTDLLPLRLDGFFFVDTILDPPPCFFSRNRSRSVTGHHHRRIGGRLDFLGTPLRLRIMDHCNGLLLLEFDRVVNPATRQWVRLPPSPPPSAVMQDFFQGHCLVYDPVVSPHYEVVLIHLLPGVLDPNNEEFREDSEWPPSPYTTHVFSSKSWRWEERSFVRQGVAAGTIADKLPGSRLYERYSVYMRKKLYVHCENHAVMRINLSNKSYRVIKCPTVSQMAGVGVLCLGKSEKGVYAGLPWNDDGWPQFRVWFLDESCEHIEWVLKSNISLQAVLQNLSFGDNNIYSSWAVTSKSNEQERAQAQEEFEWDSDDGVLLETKEDDGTYYLRQTSFLGFHPFKEIVFFRAHSRVVSYHLNTSNIQYLGILNTYSVCKSFPYTSCWTGELHESN